MVRNIRNRHNSVEDKYTRIQTSMFPLVKPDFRKLEGSKDEIIRNWMRNWIKDNLSSGEIRENWLLPKKAELAYYFGVGEGTVQNAVRQLEDEGLLWSKQRIGTLISGYEKPAEMNKLTSKRDKIVEQIKSYILSNDIEKGARLPSAKELAEVLNSKRNTVRGALEFLALNGYTKPVDDENGVRHWTVSMLPNKAEIISRFDDNITADTLAQKISVDIEKYITENCKVGDRLDTISVWAKRFNVSDKTAHDALQVLIDNGIIQTRRGRYGTIVVKMPQDKAFQPAKETSIFMPAAEASVYSYKRIENFLRNKIRDEFSVGQKMPSMKELSELMDVSTNTVRKAVWALADEGYLSLSRGRFGGIYVMDIPEEDTQSFKWLAVNPQYVKSYKN